MCESGGNHPPNKPEPKILLYTRMPSHREENAQGSHTPQWRRDKVISHTGEGKRQDVRLNLLEDEDPDPKHLEMRRRLPGERERSSLAGPTVQHRDARAVSPEIHIWTMALIQNDKDTEVSPSQSPKIIRQLDTEMEQQTSLPSALVNNPPALTFTSKS